jgi:hypothetical protein
MAIMPQQIGVLFMQQQQVQPAAIIVDMQSQQAWIILQHCSSPEVQVIVQPSLVISHLHMPIVRLQVQTIMPFIMQQSEHMPPWNIMHRFCIMLQAIGSSQEQTIFMPPVHFSIFMVHRGTMSMFGVIGAAVPPIGDDPMPGIPMPGIPIPVRSIIIVFAIVPYSFRSRAPGDPAVLGYPRPSVGRSPSNEWRQLYLDGFRLQRLYRFCGRMFGQRLSTNTAGASDILPLSPHTWFSNWHDDGTPRRRHHGVEIGLGDTASHVRNS